MLRSEMPWSAKLATAILANAIGGGCIIAILFALPVGFAWDLGNWTRHAAHLSSTRCRRIGGCNPAPGGPGGIARVGWFAAGILAYYRHRRRL